MSEAWPWLALVTLGVYHGLNPAMGWLFAVALGLQERNRGAVLRALPAIALGHEVSIALVAVLVSGAQVVATPDVLRVLGAAALIGFGLYKFFRPRSHPRWVGFRVSLPELALWSFLMATAHGAGLMLVPVLLGLPESAHAHDGQTDALALLGLGSLAQNAVAVLVHTLAMLLAMAAVALLVYDRLGVAVLRRAWLNLDGLWALAIMTAGVLTLFL